MSEKPITQRIKAVSYTHLDVYKRQLTSCLADFFATVPHKET